MPKKKERSEEEKLHYQCSKAVTQAVKKARGFLVQKCVRALREKEAASGERSGGISAAERQLSLLKSKHPHLENAAVVHRALRSIGLPMGSSRTRTPSEVGNGAESTPEVAQLERQILGSKAVRELLKSWDERVTQLRCKRLAEVDKAGRLQRASAEARSGQSASSFGADRSKRARTGKPRDAMGDAKRAMQEADAVFMMSLSGSASTILGDHGGEAGGEEVRRNRPGQRARRAAAIRREEMESTSSNPQRRASRDSSGATACAQHRPSARANQTGGGASRDKAPCAPAALAPVPEVLHPSWEATKKRKAEQSITEFKGTKITFGDD